MRTTIALALAIFASPALARGDRAAEIADTATICDQDLTAKTEVIKKLRASGWKLSTPKLGGVSMAEITGAEQFIKGSDEALISGPSSRVGGNCQFDFSKVSDQLFANIQTELEARLGSPSKTTPTVIEWSRNGISYSLRRRSPDTATILWIPEVKATQ